MVDVVGTLDDAIDVEFDPPSLKTKEERVTTLNEGLASKCHWSCKQ